MNDTTRAAAILLSVLLWSPVAPGFLSGETPAEKALVLYAGALLLSLAGGATLAGLIRAYAPDEPEEAEEEPAPEPERATSPATPGGVAPGRRVEDEPGGPA